MVISGEAVLYSETARVNSCWSDLVRFTIDSGSISAGIWSPITDSRFKTDLIPSMFLRSLVRSMALLVSRLASVRIM